MYVFNSDHKRCVWCNISLIMLSESRVYIFDFIIQSLLEQGIEKSMLSKACWGESRLLVVLQEPKHVQPQLFRQRRQAPRHFGSESTQHRGPDRGDAGSAHNPVAVAKRRRREPPQPELNACPRLGIRCGAECSWHVCKPFAVVEPTRKLSDNVVRNPDFDVGRQERVEFFLHLFVVIIACSVFVLNHGDERGKQSGPHVQVVVISSTGGCIIRIARLNKHHC